MKRVIQFCSSKKKVNKNIKNDYQYILNNQMLGVHLSNKLKTKVEQDSDGENLSESDDSVKD